ncbi:MAG: response regulator [Pseudomonadota bacterium]
MTVPYSLAGLNLLVVEDDLLIATSLREVLLQGGADMAEMCASLAQAQELVTEIRFDAAILDLTLPDGDAASFAETLDTQGVKLVFHTGHSLPDAVQARFPDALTATKPTAPKDLVYLVASLFKK